MNFGLSKKIETKNYKDFFSLRQKNSFSHKMSEALERYLTMALEHVNGFGTCQ